MICHFSCGSTSAVATLLVIESGLLEEAIYADPGTEHPSNKLFLDDFEKLTNHKITILTSSKYKTPLEVFRARRYLGGVGGAPCTTELKKIPIRDYLGNRLYESDQVFGYTSDESKRIDRFRENNPLVTLKNILVENGLSKNDCQYILDGLGLELPEMYKLGYSNSNCIGCVKAGLGYWAAIREDFPDVFSEHAILERELGAKLDNGKPKGAAINKRYINGVRHRVFLDELPLDIKPDRKSSFACGYSCGEQQEYFDMGEDKSCMTPVSSNARDTLERMKVLFNIAS